MCIGVEEDTKKAAEKDKGNLLYVNHAFRFTSRNLTYDILEEQEKAQKKEELKFIYKVWSGYTR